VKGVYRTGYYPANCTTVFQQTGLNRGDGCPLKMKGMEALKDVNLSPETKTAVQKDLSEGQYCKACSRSGGLPTIAYSPFAFVKARVELEKKNTNTPKK